MSKSILVIDTPENCQECPLEFDAKMVGVNKNSRLEILLNANICRGCGRQNFDRNRKPDWCPLEEIKDSDREELRQYRAIGTVERFRQLSEQFKPHTIDETSCPERHCNKCDKYRKEAERYQAIGTVEECQEAREKQRARKPIGRKELKDFSGQIYSLCGKCPRCGAEELLFVHTAYCPKCGQAILWNFD